MFRNKLDESDTIIRNKARLVVQGYNQIERIDFEKIFAPVARLEAIRRLAFLAYASYKNFTLYQIDVKSPFLNRFIEEKVFIEQSLGFVDHIHPDYVCKLDKTIYDLKQAPRAWYDRLSNFSQQGFY